MTDDQIKLAPRPQGGLLRRLDRVLQTRVFMATLVALAVAAGLATYAALTELFPIRVGQNTLYLLLNVDLALLLAICWLVARRIVALWIARRRGSAGAQLHVRLVAVFSALAVTPALIVALLSLLFFHVGLQGWFSERVRTAIGESQEIAEKYREEELGKLLMDARQFWVPISENIDDYMNVVDPRERTALLDRMLTHLMVRLPVREALIYDRNSKSVLGRSALAFSMMFDYIDDEHFMIADDTGFSVYVARNGTRIRAVFSFENHDGIYLILGRAINKDIISYLDNPESGAASAYRDLDDFVGRLKINITFIFTTAALLLLMTAIWLGLNFASRLVRPIGHLVAATEKVRGGDLTARVDEPLHDDELMTLSRAFNRMTSQLESQRQELIEANRQLDARRRFTEAVLSGVTAGVIGLDPEGRIAMANEAAAQLLDAEVGTLIGADLSDLIPEMSELIVAARRRGGRAAQSQVQVHRDKAVQTLLVRIVADRAGDDVRGYIVTFDDVTELLSAQRKAAWADVARRIAHEIKNPLTPIQLSAERLKRKYLKEISSDPDTFRTCTDTIVRHVDDIGRMVDEFSAFARMPQPAIEPHDLTQIVRDAVILQATGRADLSIRFVPPGRSVVIPCDSRQVTQALTNLLQNAVDAIEGRREQEPDAPPGEIEVRLDESPSGAVAVAVADNGKGLPAADRHKLTEPYVTTRAKGTGLGLAIVKKIMEDHGGDLSLTDRPGGGAVVRLVFHGVDAARPSAEADAQDGAMTGKEVGHGA